MAEITKYRMNSKGVDLGKKMTKTPIPAANQQPKLVIAFDVLLTPDEYFIFEITTSIRKTNSTAIQERNPGQFKKNGIKYARIIDKTKKMGVMLSTPSYTKYRDIQAQNLGSKS
jgi:hypothetical protein